MSSRQRAVRVLCAATAGALMAGVQFAYGADAAPQPKEGIEEVIVTGSYLRGTPKDAALPVSIFDAETLAEQGSPNMVELVQRIPAVNGGNLGESNRFLGGAPQGTATVNLRGLGLTRTLVLLNGQRLPTINSVGADYADVNQIPMGALAQVEVLRDGAAATYGSDAVAGVVNFITRRDIEGLEFKGSYKAIDDSDGDYDGHIVGGWVGDRGNLLFSAGFSARNEIRLTDFPYMLPRTCPGWDAQGRCLPAIPGAGSPGDGVSGAANPGTYFTIASALDADMDGAFETATQGTAFGDLGCVELGSTRPTGSTTACRYPYALQEAPINDEKHYNLFGEANFELADNLRFHSEAHFARNIVPNVRESASLSTILFPTPIETSGASPGGGTSPFPALPGETASRFYIPPNNPGLVSLMTAGGCPFDAQVCADALARGVLTHQVQWRPFAMGGSPLFGGDTERDENVTTSWRVVGGLDGDFANGWGWLARVTYGRGERDLVWPDNAVNRIQLGLRGLGGPGCSETTGVPGVGPCQWLNPFANSITTSIANGLSYNRATGRPQGPANSASFAQWMRVPLEEVVKSELLVFEGVFNGDITAFTLPGGEPTWALGGQWRYISRDFTVNDVHDAYGTPCVDSPPFGDGVPGCPVPGVGPVTFRNPEAESFLDSHVWALFGEVRLPILESLEADIAVRREEYAGEIGSTTNPRVSLRWEPLDWLVFRGSAGTTFRAPPDSITFPRNGRFQAQFANPVTTAQTYRAVDIQNNPLLQPEEADTFNVGFVIQTEDLELGGTRIGALSLTVDHYIVNFSKELQSEQQAAVYGQLFPGPAAGVARGSAAHLATFRCNIDELRNRFTFVSGLGTNDTVYAGGPGMTAGTFPNCHPNNFNVVAIKRLNGASVDIKGIDFSATWTYADLYGGDLEIGVEGSHLMQYKRSAVPLVGTNIIVEPATDRAGTAELLGAFFSYPDWRTSPYVKYTHGDHNVRWTTRYYSAVQDRNAGFIKRDSHVLHDLSYRFDLTRYNLTLTGTVQNIFDDEPPYVRSQNNYDYATYSPLLRTFEIGLEYRLGAR